MNGQSRRAVYVIFFMFLLECAVAVGTDAPGVPETERNMRLVSYPCDVTIDELRASEGKGLVIYKWNGTDYEEAAALERGVGYFVSAAAGVSAAGDVCSNRGAPAPAELKLKQGWNLIGLPVNRAMSVRDALGALADDPDTRVFTLRGGIFVLLNSSDRLEPRKGYWVYAAADASVAPDAFSKELRLSSSDLINVGTPDNCGGIWEELFHDNVIAVGKTVTLNAEIVEAVSKSAASNVAWSVDKTEVATIDGNGALTAKAAGTVEVKAAVAGLPGVSLKVNVIDMAAPVCLSLGPGKGATIFPKESVKLSLKAVFFDPGKPCASNKSTCNLRSEDVFNTAAFTMSAPAAGTISYNLFTAGNTVGKNAIKAEYKGIKSNTVMIEIKGSILQEISISVDPYAFSTPCLVNSNSIYAIAGKKLNIKATGRFATKSSVETKSVAESALWTVSAPEIARVENGILTPIASGTVQVQAMLEDKQSKTLDIQVVNENAPVCLNLSLKNNMSAQLYTEETTGFQAELITITSASTFISRDVSDEAIFSQTAPEAGTLYGGYMFKAGQTEGETTVTASMGSQKSNGIMLAVRRYDWRRVSITNNTNSLVPSGCGESNVPVLAVGAETKLNAEGFYESGKSYSYKMKDITETAVWYVSDASIAEISGGVLKGLRPGKISVTASMGNVTSVPYYFNVRGNDELLCLTLSSNSGVYKTEPGSALKLKAAAYVFPSSELCKSQAGGGASSNYGASIICKVDVTKSVSQWSMTDTNAGSIDGDGIFHASDYEKYTDVTAAYVGSTSNRISITVRKKNWTRVMLYIKNGYTVIPFECGSGSGNPLIATEEKLSLAATGFYNDADSSSYYYSSYPNTIDVTQNAEWKVSDDSVAEIKDGEITGKRAGSVTVTASIGGITSDLFMIEVRDKDDTLCMALYAPSVVAEPSTDLQFKATAFFFAPNNVCETQYSKYASLCQADVTKNVAAWEMSKPDAGSIDANGNFHASDQEAATDVTATYSDVVSNKVTIRVRTKTWFSINISLVNGAYTSKPYSCGSLSGDRMIAPGDKQTLKAVGYYAYGISNGNYSDSNSMDITEQGTWKVSDESIGEIRGGVFTGKRAGTVTITTSFGGVSGEYRVTVFEKEKPLCVVLSPSSGLKIPPGGASKLAAIAYFLSTSEKCKTGGQKDQRGSCYSYVTSDVSSWELTQPSAGSIDSDGTFNAGDTEMSTQVSAVYDNLKSNSITVNVKKVYWMLVWVSGNALVLPQCPLSSTYSGCYAAKLGDTYQFTVHAQEDSYMWTTAQDVTGMAKWEVSDPAVAEMSSGGTLKAKKQGLVWIRAYVGDARTDKIWVAVGEKAGFEFVLAGTTGDYGGFKPIKPLQVGSSYPIKAVHYKYNSSFTAADVTNAATWNVADNTLGQITTSSSSYSYYNSSGKYFKGLAPGMADVTAVYNGLTSNTLTFDVWNLQTMTYCDAANVNMGEWKDSVSSATLETDCKVYEKGESVRIRYSAYVENKIYLDNCLDLFILDDKDNIVRTLRNEGCTSEPLDRSTMGRKSPDYQTLAVWDMKDDAGNAAPAGQYFAVARFYIVWEPVIRLPFTVK